MRKFSSRYLREGGVNIFHTERHTKVIVLLYEGPGNLFVQEYDCHCPFSCQMCLLTALMSSLIFGVMLSLRVPRLCPSCGGGVAGGSGDGVWSEIIEPYPFRIV